MLEELKMTYVHLQSRKNNCPVENFTHSEHSYTEIESELTCGLCRTGGRNDSMGEKMVTSLTAGEGLKGVKNILQSEGIAKLYGLMDDE